MGCTRVEDSGCIQDKCTRLAGVRACALSPATSSAVSSTGLGVAQGLVHCQRVDGVKVPAQRTVQRWASPVHDSLCNVTEGPPGAYPGRASPSVTSVTSYTRVEADDSLERRGRDSHCGHTPCRQQTQLGKQGNPVQPPLHWSAELAARGAVRLASNVQGNVRRGAVDVLQQRLEVLPVVRVTALDQCPLEPGRVQRPTQRHREVGLSPRRHTLQGVAPRG